MEESNFRGARNAARYPIFAGMLVFVYRNLNVSHVEERYRHPVLYSIRAAETVRCAEFSPLKSGYVFHHSPCVRLMDCHFVVKCGEETTSSGWKAVRETGRKNVHAGIMGRLVSWDQELDPCGMSITYNPYLHENFVEVGSNNPVFHANEIFLTTSRTGRKTTHIVASGVN